jgi:hypothetical protein
VLTEQLIPAELTEAQIKAFRRFSGEIFRLGGDSVLGVLRELIELARSRKKRHGDAGNSQGFGPTLGKCLSIAWFSYRPRSASDYYGGLSPKQVADLPERLHRLADEIERVNSSIYASPVQTLLAYADMPSFRVRGEVDGEIVDDKLIEYGPRSYAIRHVPGKGAVIEGREYEASTKKWRQISLTRVSKKDVATWRTLMRKRAVELKGLPGDLRVYAWYLQKPMEPPGVGTGHKNLALDSEVRVVHLIRAATRLPRYRVAGVLLNAVFDLAQAGIPARDRRARTFDAWNLERRCSRHNKVAKPLLLVKEKTVFAALLEAFAS